MKAAKIGLGLAAVITLAGCSVQMAYNNLDRLARWSTGDLVDMNDAQRAYFDAHFDVLWAWHRREHLPEYAVFLESFASRLGDGIGAAQMQAAVDQVFTWADEIEDRALPMAAELLASLSDEQIEQLTAALEDSNRELTEPEAGVSLERAQRRWGEELVDRFTRFSGRLSAVQHAYVKNRAAAYRPELVLWADYRRRWQEDFLALLERRRELSLSALERRLRDLSARREQYYGPELAPIYRHNNRLAREMSVWLVNSLTPRQRERFSDRLLELADDFRELAAEARPAPDAAALPCLAGC